MSTVDILGYLNSKGLNPKFAGGQEYHLACFFHGEDPGARGRLYVNCDPGADILGLYECKVCDAHGAFPTIQRHFGDRPLAEADDEDSETRLEILRVAAAWYHTALGDNPEVFGYLRGAERGLTTETIISHQIGYASDEIEQDLGTNTITKLPSRALYRNLRDLGYTTSDILATGLVVEGRDKRLVDSLSGMITIPYAVAGNVVQIRGRAWPWKKDDSKPKYKTCGGNQSRLFNTDAVWDTDEIIVTEGEFDAMVVEQNGFPNVVGVPGAKAWQDAWDGYVNKMRRIWLVYDRDVAGEQGATKIQARFGAKVRRIHLSPEGSKCDPTDWFAQNTATDFEALLKDARSGGLLVSVHDARFEHANRQSLPGLKLGIAKLDGIIKPGLHPAQVLTLLAKTGTGKTISLLNTMQCMRMVEGQEDLKFLFVSLEQTRGEWWERARRIWRFYNLEGTDDDCEEWWQDNISIVDRNRLPMGDLRACIDDFDYNHGQLPDAILIDYLGYFARSFPSSSKYEQVSEAIMSVKELGKDVRCPLIVPHQVSRIVMDGDEVRADSARDSGVIEETSDFLFMLWSPDNMHGRTTAERSGIVKMKIGKSRHGGRGEVYDFQWGPLSLVMVPRHEQQRGAERELVQLARDELAYTSDSYRDSWETAVWRHRTGIKDVSAKPGFAVAQEAF